jgi:hypothetical protein
MSVVEQHRPSWFPKSREWVHKNRLKLALGGIAVSAGLTFASGGTHEVVETAVKNIPAVGAGMIAMEAMWIGGGAMMAASVGEHIKNPLKIKSHLPEIAAKANDSKLFKAGFIVNTVGAVGEFVIPAAAVCMKLPPETWGVLGPSLVDLGITIGVRRATLNAIHESQVVETVHPVTDEYC